MFLDQDFDRVLNDLTALFRNGARTSTDKSGNYSNVDGIKTVHYKEGAMHREDGPAVIYADKSKPDEYWLDGRRSTKEEVDSYLARKNDKKLHVVFLDGHNYTITGSTLKELKIWLADRRVSSR